MSQSYLKYNLFKENKAQRITKKVFVEDFFLHVLRTVNDNKYDFAVCITRKCYVLFKLYLQISKTENNCLNSKIFLDRDVSKIEFFDFIRKNVVGINKKKNVRVLLFDDSVLSGKTLQETMELIERNILQGIDGNDDCQVTVHFDVAILSVSSSFLNTDKFSEMKNKDINFYFSSILSRREMSTFIESELYEIQENMMPFVVDLPVSKEIEIPKNKLLDFMNDNKKWLYIDYSFPLLGKKFGNGFFALEDKSIRERLGKLLIKCTVKMRYEEVGDSYKVRFVPFAIINSSLYGDIRRIFDCIFEDTEFYSMVQLYNDPKKNWVSVYRSVINVISYYVYCIFLKDFFAFSDIDEIIFNQYFKVKNRFGFEKYNKSFNQIFGLDISDTFEFKVTNINSIINSFMSRFNRVPVRTESESDSFVSNKSFREFLNTAISKIYLERREIDLKRYSDGEGTVDLFLPYHHFLELVNVRENDENMLFALALMFEMLDSGFISNEIQLDENNNIIKGFRYGVNSKIYLSQDNKIMYMAVYTFYNKIFCDFDMYKAKFNVFFDDLKKYFTEKNYFNSGELNENSIEILSKFYDLNGYDHCSEVLRNIIDDKCVNLNFNMFDDEILIHMINHIVNNRLVNTEACEEYLVLKPIVCDDIEEYVHLSIKTIADLLFDADTVQEEFILDFEVLSSVIYLQLCNGKDSFCEDSITLETNNQNLYEIIRQVLCDNYETSSHSIKITKKLANQFHFILYSDLYFRLLVYILLYREEKELLLKVFIHLPVLMSLDQYDYDLKMTLDTKDRRILSSVFKGFVEVFKKTYLDYSELQSFINKQIAITNVEISSVSKSPHIFSIKF